jgi:hypothetical protein
MAAEREREAAHNKQYEREAKRKRVRDHLAQFKPPPPPSS